MYISVRFFQYLKKHFRIAQNAARDWDWVDFQAAIGDGVGTKRNSRK